jgi:uncharacterized delta-60 repeat protein
MIANYIESLAVQRWAYYSSGLASVILATLALSAGTVNAQPINDDFTNAIVLSTLSGTAAGVNNGGATLETCEPNSVLTDDYGDVSVDNSVWYRWTATAGGPVAFDTIGSDFDTVLAVYTVNGDLCNLSQLSVADDDNGSHLGGDTNLTSQLTFTAVVGVTYYLSVNANVDGGGATGNVVLNWSPASAPVAAIPSGTFQFTRGLYVVSERDSTSPLSGAGSNVLGARVTVTRVDGQSGRVKVDYQSKAQTYTNIFTTNYFGTNIYGLDTNTPNKITNISQNFIYYSNFYQSYTNGAYVYHIISGLQTNSSQQTYWTNSSITADANTVLTYTADANIFPSELQAEASSYSGSSNLYTNLTYVGGIVRSVTVQTNLFGSNYGTNTLTFNAAVVGSTFSTKYTNSSKVYTNAYKIYSYSFSNKTDVVQYGTNIFCTNTYSGGGVRYTNYFYTNTYYTNFTLQTIIVFTNLNSSYYKVTNDFYGVATNIFCTNITSGGNFTNFSTDTVTKTQSGDSAFSPTNLPDIYVPDFANHTTNNPETNNYSFFTTSTKIVNASSGFGAGISGTLTFDDYEMSQDILLPVSIVSNPNNSSLPSISSLISLELFNPRWDDLESSNVLMQPKIGQNNNALVNALSFSYPPDYILFNFERSTFRVEKNAGSITIYVLHTGNTSVASSVQYQINPAPALNTFSLQAGSDYALTNSDFIPVTGTLNWAIGDGNPKPITIPILNNGLIENNVDFQVQLSNPTPQSTAGSSPTNTAIVGLVSSATVTILFDNATCGQQPAGSVDRCWNTDNSSTSVPQFLKYPGTQGGVSGSVNGNGGTVYAVVEQPDGKALVAGSFISFDSNPYNRIVRLLSNGYQDTSFLAWPNSGANSYITSMALQPDGRILIGGNFTAFNGTNRFHVARLNTNGSLDTSFMNGTSGTALGVRGTNAAVLSLALQSNGQLMIAGQFTSVHGTNCNSVARLNADGTLDLSFNPGTGPTKVVDGVEMAATINSVVVDSLGRVLIGGDFNAINGVARGGVARLNADGSVDTTFDTGIGTYNVDTGNTDPVYALALQPDGNLLVGGSFSYFQLAQANGILRLASDGSLDTTFNSGTGTSNEVTGVADTVKAITLQSDGLILIGGDFTTYNQTRRYGVARLFSYGSLDTSFMDTYYNQFAGVPNHYFNPDAVDFTSYPQGNTRNFVGAIAVEPGTANVIIGGQFLRVGGGYTRTDIRPRSNVARLIGGATPGPGNLQFSHDKYTVDKSAGSLYVSLVRTNGSLGPASATLSTNKTAAGPGIASVDDFSLPPGSATPTWPTLYSLNTSYSWQVSPAVYGPNQQTLPYTSRSADVYLSISNNPNINGNVNANLALSHPDSSFFLGGERIPLGVALGSQDAAPMTILDNNYKAGVLGFSSATYTVNQNAGTAKITVIRTNFSGGVVQVSYATSNGSATNGVDYTNVTGTLTFQTGDSSKTFTIPILKGTTVQPDKKVNLRLFTPTAGASLGQSNAVLTIINNSSKFGHISFVSSTYTVSEDGGTALIGIARLGGAAGTISVTAVARNGTAINGVNYTGSTNTLTWANTEVSTKFLSIPIRQDGAFTPDLTVNVCLTNGFLNSSASNSVLGYGGTNAVLTIVNDDIPGAVQFATNSFAVKKYAGSAQIPVVRTGGSVGTVVAHYATVEDSAKDGTNYTATAGTLTFLEGEVTKYLSVPILAEATNGTVSLDLVLSNAFAVTPLPRNALGSPTKATLTIIDTDTVNEIPGSPDVTYGGLTGFNDTVYALALQPNHQLVAVGNFTMACGVRRQHIARLNPNGSLDASFSFPSSAMGADNSVRAVALQSDGRILVGGAFSYMNGVAMRGVARLNNDGTLDSQFDPGSGADSPVYALAEETFVNGERKILVGGSFNFLSGQVAYGIGRLNEDGTPDIDFNYYGFGANGTVYAMAVQSDGKILIGGDFTAMNGIPVNHVARLNPDGAVDLTFTNAAANDSVQTIALQKDGQILIGGQFTSVNGNTNFNHIARLNRADGSADSSFTPGLGANDSVFSIALQMDNRIVLGGEFTRCSDVTRNRITRLNTDGTVDPSINFGVGADGFVSAVAVEESSIVGYPDVPDEKILMAGGFTHYFGESHSHLARIYGGSISGAGAFDFSAPLYSVNENSASVLITINRAGGTAGLDPDGSTTVTFATVGGTAVDGVNYASLTTNLTFALGEVQETVNLPILNDHVINSNLTVQLTLTPEPGASYGNQSEALVSIVNIDSSINFSSATYLATKYGSTVSNGFATVTVNRSGATFGTSTVLFNTTGSGTAVPGVDYTAVTNQLINFAPGVAIQTVQIPVINGVSTGDRTVGLALSGVNGSALYSPSNGVLTILDRTLSKGYFMFSSDQYKVYEGGSGAVGLYTNALITVMRTNGSIGIATVQYSTADGTALVGSKYRATSGTLNFADGELSKSFFVPVVNTTTLEPTEYLFVKLSNPSGGAGLLNPTNARLAIINRNVNIVVEAPVNDFFFDAITLVGMAGTTNGSNLGANLEGGEPTIVNADGLTSITNSVWYQWTAPSNGVVSFDTFNGTNSVDTVIAVYTNSFSSNYLVRGNNDYIPLIQPQSQVTFPVVAGTTYFLSVNGNVFPEVGYTSAGAFQLNWEEVPASVPSGTFQFTASNFEVSDSDSTAPQDPNLQSGTIRGARITVTRTGGASGRVKVPYTVVPDRSQTLASTNGVLIFDDFQMSADIILPVTPLLSFSSNNFTVSPPVSDLLYLGTPVLDGLEYPDLLPPVAVTTPAFLTIRSDQYLAVPGVTNTWFNIERSTFRVAEGVETVSVLVSRYGVFNPIGWTTSSGRPGNVSVDFSIYQNGFTLQADSDYYLGYPGGFTTSVNSNEGLMKSSNSGTLVWCESDPSPKQIKITITNDSLAEFNQDLQIRLSNPRYSGVQREGVSGNCESDKKILSVSIALASGAVLGQVTQASLTVLFDDQPAGAVDQTWNGEGNPNSNPPNLVYPGTQGGVSDTANGNGGTVNAVAEQPDGKAILAGSFISFDSKTYNRIVRVLTNGYYDPTFLVSPNSGANESIAALALQPDGKVLIGGNFTAFNGVNRYRIARLNSNGTLDMTFAPGLGADGRVCSIALQTNGQVIIGGDFNSVNGTAIARVARLNADGSLDASFNPGVGPNGTVYGVVSQDNGQIYIGGGFDSVGGTLRGGVARLNTDGTLDDTYDIGIGTYNLVTRSTDPVKALALQTDGKLLAGGSFEYVQMTAYNGLVRFNSDATVDTTFSTLGAMNGTYNPFTGVADNVNAITLQPDGAILIGGDFTQINQTRRVGISRLYGDGSVDTTFMDTAYIHFAGLINHYHNPDAVNPADYPQGNHPNAVNAIALEAGGNVIIGGSFLRVGGGSYDHSASVNNTIAGGIYGLNANDPSLNEFSSNGRMDIRLRSNVARLIGGATPGPGNIQFVYDQYSADKSGGTNFVSLIRTNGNVGTVSVAFNSLPAPVGQPGLAIPGVDFTIGNFNPVWSNGVPQSFTNSVEGANYNVPSAAEYLNIINNTLINGNRNAALALSSPVSVFTLGGEVIPVGAALGALSISPLTIIDDNFPAGTFGFSQSAYYVNASSNAVAITVTRTNGTTGTVQVKYATFNGTAMAPTNYSSVAGTLTFNQGVASQTFTVPIVPGTSLIQPDRTVNLRLYGITGGGQPGLTNAMLTIVNNNYGSGHIAFAYATNAVMEDAGTARVVLNRLGASVGTIDVTLVRGGGTAVYGTNYGGTNTVVHWNSGDALPKTVLIPVLQDGRYTSNLTVNLQLTNGLVNGGAADSVLTLSVLTNSTLVIGNVDYPGRVSFTAAAYSVKKYGGYALIPVIRTGGSAGTVTVNYHFVNGTATNGVHYVGTNGMLTFTNGVLSQFIRVPVVNLASSGLRSLSLVLSNASVTPSTSLPWTALGNPSSAVLNILDTDTVNETPGVIDVTYSSFAGFNGNVYALAQQTNRNLIVGGDFTMANGTPRQRLARLTPDGLLDPSFILPSSAMGANAQVNALAIQTDGRVVVGGGFSRFNGAALNRLARLNYDGSLDSTFNVGSGADNPVFAVAQSPWDQKIVVAGSFTRLDGVTFNSIGRLNGDGTADTTFNPNGLGANGTVYAVAVQPNDGKIIIGGDFTLINGSFANHLARLNPDGSLDASFALKIGNGPSGSVRALCLQLDGAILVGGMFTNLVDSQGHGTNASRLARLLPDGSVDTLFNRSGSGPNDGVACIALQTDERIVIGGQFTLYNGVTRNRTARLNPDGSVDTTINFGTGAPGVSDFVTAVVVQQSTVREYPASVPDEKIIIGGVFSQFNGVPANHLARIYGGSIAGVGSFQFLSADYRIDENSLSPAVVTIVRTGGTSGPNDDGSGDVTVPFATHDLTARAGVNYTSVTNTMVFPPGEVVKTIYVPVLDDLLLTNDLTVGLSVNPVTPAGVGAQPTAVLTIVNVESAVSFVAATYQVPQNVVNGLGYINVLRLGSSSGTASVVFNTTTNGSALPGVDFTPVTNQSIVFNPGVTNVAVAIPILTNAIPKGNRTVSLQLSNAVNTTLYSPSNATLVIVDTLNSPGTLSFASTNLVVNEGDGYAYLTVNRSQGVSGIVSVSCVTVPGTAVPNLNYQPSPNAGATNTVTFADGEITRVIAIPLIDNTLVQGDVSFSVQLVNPTGRATLIAPTNASVTIMENDLGVAFVASTNQVNENDGPIYLGLTRVGKTNLSFAVSVQTVAGTALPGINYVSTSNRIVFSAGETYQLVAIPLIYNTNVTGDVNFNVQLLNPGLGVTLFAPSNTVIVVHDIDSGMSFSTNSSRVLKNAGQAVFTVTCSNPQFQTNSYNGFSVRYYTKDGTAKAGTDYQAVSGTLVFSNSVPTNSFVVPIYNNGLVTGDKSFTVVLTNATGNAQVVSPSTQEVAIAEINSGLQFSQSDYQVLKNGVSAAITVLRTGFTDSVVSVNYLATNGTAINGINFVSTNGALVFTNGVTTQKFNVALINNSVVQPNVAALLQLSSPTNALLVAPSAATLTIVENGGSYVVPAGSQMITNVTSHLTDGILYSNDTAQIWFGLRDAAGLDVTNLIAYLLATNGVVSPTPASNNYGPLKVYGHSVSRAFSFTARGTNSQVIAPTLALYDGAKYIGTAVFGYSIGTWAATFANTNRIVINDNTNASPYPSIITVSGVGGALVKATVTLTNVIHTAPSDMDVLVVSPAQKNTLVMAHAGGLYAVSNLTVTFNDAATNALPRTTVITNGTYKPTGYLPVKNFP